MRERVADLQAVQAGVLGARDAHVAVPRQGRLIDFDRLELSGWIEGEDGALYAFSAADVLGDEDIAIGQSVRFVAAGELASEVRASEDAPGAPRLLTGPLLSYDEALLCGWIEGEDANLYAFGVGDVIDDAQLRIGQRLAFCARGERALDVRAVEAQIATSEARHGRLLSYDAVELRGWIEEEGGELYAFSADEIEDETEIHEGQAVAFRAAGERAFAVRATAPERAPVPMTGRLLDYDTSELRGRIAGDDGRTYAFDVAEVLDEGELLPGQALRFLAQADRAFELRGVAPAFGRGITRPVAAAPRWALTAASFAKAPIASEPSPTRSPLRRTVPAVLLVLALALSALLLRDRLGDRSSASPEASAVTSAPAEPAPAAVSQAAPEPQPPPSVETAAVADVPGPTADEPVASRPAPAPAEPVLEPEPRVIPSPPPARKLARVPVAVSPSAQPSAWWQRGTGPGQLQLVYAGHLAERPAIVLMFDGRLPDAQGAQSHIRVRRHDGSPLNGDWSLGADGRMLSLAARPGRYEVSVEASLRDAAGRSIGAALSGPVVVH